MFKGFKNWFQDGNEQRGERTDSPELEQMIETWRHDRLGNYQRMPQDIREHAGIEEAVTAGGYGYRQILELVQNGADAILEEYDARGQDRGEQEPQSRIQVYFDGRRLYVANTGTPLSRDGVEALLMSHSSPKRRNQIGRFGIGFKSLLRLGGTIDLFSRTVSLRFDPQRCQREIRQSCGLAADQAAPSLRLAWCLDWKQEAADDAQLAGYDWASTVVRAEVVNVPMARHIEEEIRGFPARFLLFLPIPVQLTLFAPSVPSRRIIREAQRQHILLMDGEEKSLWRIFEQQVRITSEAARADATHLHQRDEVPLAWAIPVDSRRQEAGTFWAFFPTGSQTRVPGILNAPWKLNSDRQAIIDGEWNQALMLEAAGMIVKALPGLTDTAAPGQVLDYFPRNLDRKDEVGATLVEAIWLGIMASKVIPDASGQLQYGIHLRRMPLEDNTLLERWCELASPDAMKKWVHPSCMEGDRKARLGELARRIPLNSGSELVSGALPALAMGSLRNWMEDIATPEMDTAREILLLASDCAQVISGFDWSRVRADLAIIPTREGCLAPAGQVVMGLPAQQIPGQQFVADELVEDQAIRVILTDVFRVRSIVEGNWGPVIENVLKLAKQTDTDEAWRNFWITLRCGEMNERRDIIIRHASEIRIRRKDGSWQYADAVLMPGSIVSASDSCGDNDDVLFDENFHEIDRKELTSLGLSDQPQGNVPVERDDLLGAGYTSNSYRVDYYGIMIQWTNMAIKAYRQHHRNMNPQSFLAWRINMPSGFVLLNQLKGLANARLTLALIKTQEVIERDILLVHNRDSAKYARVKVQAPLFWLLCEKGHLLVGTTAIPFRTVHEKAQLPLLEKVHSLAPVLPKLRAIEPDQSCPTDTNSRHAFWEAVADHLVHRRSIREGLLNDLWNDAAHDGWVPDKLVGQDLNIGLNEVYYTGSADLATRARDLGMVVVELNDQAAALWRTKGASSLDELFQVQWDEKIPGGGLLQEAVPEIIPVLADGMGPMSLTQVVRGLRTTLSGHAAKIPCAHWEGVLYLDRDQLDSLSRQECLSHILKEAAVAGWLSCEPDEAVRQIADATLDTRREKVAEGTDLGERLLRAVDNKVYALRIALGSAVGRALPDDASPLLIARLAVELLGPSVLQEDAIYQAIVAADLRPPIRWGTAEARVFVAGLGFPDAYAERQGTRRDPEILVSGPIPLPSLHDYQVEVRDGLAELISTGTGRRRAVVSLPTGGGKTRVMVQAAVELVLKPLGSDRTVLWIAQTDELCEQAVQAFRQVWINLGAQGVDLRVIRFWGGHANPVPPGEHEPTVAIATIQTLNSRIGVNALEWLSRPGLVVVDECHHAITRSYTSLLRWLDVSTARSAHANDKEPPLIGLSATPFRMDDEESLRLARRFDQRWFPADQERLHQKLLTGRFLARAEHALLRSGATISRALLTDLDNLIDSQDEFRLDGIFERINRELALDVSRNQLLIEEIRSSDAKQILFFTNSVDHAKEMAARLCLSGISAGAVSGETPPTTRRWFLNQFQKGKIRVLCNHSVLTTGFDAPSTDLVLIARQVKSPVSYMQMVGRGLRGPLNGGTETCKILTVLDNLGRFADHHPYHYCANLYSAG